MILRTFWILAVTLSAACLLCGVSWVIISLADIIGPPGAIGVVWVMVLLIYSILVMGGESDGQS